MPRQKVWSTPPPTRESLSPFSGGFVHSVRAISGRVKGAAASAVLDVHADIWLQFTEARQILLQAIRVAAAFEATHERFGRPQED